MTTYEGLHISSYHAEASFGVKVCGLIELSQFSYCSVTEDFEKHLLNIAKSYCYNSIPQGNFLFAISTYQLTNPSRPAFLTYLLEHPNTHVIYHYKNNAHGPACVLVCMHHMYPDDVEKQVVNNVAEYKARLKITAGTHHIV